MALKRSQWAAGYKTAPVSREAGGVVAEAYEYVVTENLAVGDIIEIGCLPAFHTVVDAILVSDEVGTATFDVGLVSGDYGTPDNARTSDAVIFAGAADASVARTTLASAFRIVPVEKDRGVGVKVATAGITAANQKITLVLFTKQ